MGKKNKNKGGNDDEDFKEADFSTKFVSHKANVAKEMAEAERAAGGGSDDEGANKKQNRKKRGGNKEINDDDFKAAPTKIKVATGGDSDQEIDLQKEIAENFEGVSKKNTRKKKNNMGNVYGNQDALAGAFDEGADSDEVHAKKGGKTNKGGKHQGKKEQKKKNKQQEESEPEEEEKKEDEPEAAKEASESEEKDFPINMVYCGQCGLPPEYCTFGQKDASGCKEWLGDRYPQLYQEIYGEAAVKSAPKKDDKEEEKKGEGEEEDDGIPKPKKKVKFGKEVGVITVYKQKRGGRKTISQIVGFEHYTKDMKGLASKFGKKFSCGCNLATDDIHGDCISVQGDVEDRLVEILEQDKDLKEMNIPVAKIKFVEDGNKKGRKRPPPKAQE